VRGSSPKCSLARACRPLKLLRRSQGATAKKISLQKTL
jgi:hypothetical protein